MKRSVGIVVDHPERDLGGIVFLATLLVDAGVNVRLYPWNLVSRSRGLLLVEQSDDLVILNYLRPNNSYLGPILEEAGIPFAVLETEGGVLVSIEKYFEKALPKEDWQRVSRYFSWGNELAEGFVERGLIDKDRVVVTGSPRMDFYVAPLANSLVRQDGQGSDDIILVNGNFTLSNPAFQTPEKEIDMLVNQLGYDRVEMEQMLERCKKAKAEMIRLTIELAKRYPAREVVFRPHPFENVESYREIFPDLPNLSVTREGTVDRWILRSKLLLHRSCSTAVEAALVGVPAVSPQWVVPMGVQPTSEACSIPVEDEEALFALADQIDRDAYTFPGHLPPQEIIEDFFFRVDGESGRRVAEGVLKFLESSPRNESMSTSIEDTDPGGGVSLQRNSFRVRCQRFFGRILSRGHHNEESHVDENEWVEPWSKTAKYFDADAVSKAQAMIGSAYKDLTVPEVSNEQAVIGGRVIPFVQLKS
ncbi:MAG: hypothetical protein HRU46_00100 [Verrucomicrobiales bacterium]|nr:hypothetical protein [Verrucomicrobiales bacterium]